MAYKPGDACYRKIVICGTVQGVGFRPFVQRLAKALGVSGIVRNQGGSVEIHACGSDFVMGEFIRRLKSDAPDAADIIGLEVFEAEVFAADGFSIPDSADELDSPPFMPPDFGICESCLLELADETNRRFGNPFNSCVSCGPRFSVIRRLPYDRISTSMDEFPLCADCGAEYASEADRRGHAQTICCNNCGPRLKFHSKENGFVNTGNEISACVTELERGNILAVKGVGGFHFACSPFNTQAVDALRRLKGRDNKPFAVMFRSLDAIAEVCAVSAAEEKLLASPERPIVLLSMKQTPFAEGVIRGDTTCGCFLPYTPLHALLLKKTPALVMTSANRSGSAIFTGDTEMIEFLNQSDIPEFSGVLCHNREILRPVEDSVVQIADGSPQILRRSRGYVPVAVPLDNKSGADFLALGGDLKAAFCLVRGGWAYQSQYFGDLEEQSVLNRFSDALDDYLRLFSASPSHVLCDLHPNYFSSALAETLNLPVTRVQHHHAHVASVMAEHRLERVIGVAFDGTGYGADGKIWGGEFLLCEESTYKRLGHLEYTQLIGGDSAAKDAAKTALCYLYPNEPGNICGDADIVYAAINSGMGTSSSGMGRIFDAVAALLGICTFNSFEGECAIKLQQAAQYALKSEVRPYPLEFKFDGGLMPDAAGLAKEIYRLKDKISVPALALGFHHAVADMVEKICGTIAGRENTAKVALSGGVFQNPLLLELTSRRLRTAGLEVFTNRQSSTNDGGIALGQAYIGGKQNVYCGRG